VLDDVTLRSLATRSVDGDRDALDQLLRELRPAVVRVARLVVGPGSPAAEDAAQEALLDLTRGIATLRDASSVRAWALRISTRRATKVARRERLLGRRVVPSPASGVSEAEAVGLRRELRAAFYALPPRMRAVAVLRLYAGASEGETAAALGCSVGTVKSQLHDARARLAKSLRAAGVELPSAERSLSS
jgi:RNA polymerase sigma factor (sigma-70 family)